jgi:hypothetical protein
MKRLVPLAALALAACAQPLSQTAPVYGCQDLQEFGCPNIQPADDPEPNPGDLIPNTVTE